MLTVYVCCEVQSEFYMLFGFLVKTSEICQHSVGAFHVILRIKVHYFLMRR
jgi:hypothetical protein